jgi:hypothetical protein
MQLPRSARHQLLWQWLTILGGSLQVAVCWVFGRAVARHDDHVMHAYVCCPLFVVALLQCVAT